MTEASDTARKTLRWRHGALTIDAFGAMLARCKLTLRDGRQISPMHVPPWAHEPEDGDNAGLLRNLAGEWPCVPFGACQDRSPQGQWPGSRRNHAKTADVHGFGANHVWTWDDCPPNALQLSVDYPPDDVIMRLERLIRPDPALPAIDFELAITAREACTLPIGLHPVFRLPKTPQSMTIAVNGHAHSLSFPGKVDASSLFAPDISASPWQKVALRDGSFIDASKVPLLLPAEELLQVLDVPGEVMLTNLEENYAMRLTWNSADFPSLLLWYSNYGRQAPPWSGRHLALGVEPACSAFDLGSQISCADNPISLSGVPTARKMRRGETIVTRYRIEAQVAGGR